MGKDGFGPGRRGRAVSAGLALMMAYAFISNTFGFFVLPVSEGLGIPRAAFTLYFSILSVVGMAAAPLAAVLLRRLPLYILILAGLVVGAGSFLVLSAADSIGVFYATALIFGLVQQSTTSVAAVAAVDRAFQGKSGGAMGLVMTGTGVVSMTMSLVLPRFIEAYSWRAGYRLQAGLWALFMLYAAVALHEKEQSGPAAVTSREEGGAGWKRALHAPVFYLLFLIIAVSCVCSIFIHHLPAYYAERGMDPVAAGRVTAVFNVAMILSKLLIGWLYDRIGHVLTAGLTMALLAAGPLLMGLGGFGAVIAGTVLFAFGIPAVTVIFPLIARHIFGGRDLGSIWSVLSMAVSLGTAAGSPLWGALYDSTGSYSSGMLTIPLLTLLAAAALACAAAHRYPWSRETAGTEDL